MQYILHAIVLLLVLGCDKHESKIVLDGGKLLEQKCSSCHNTDLPPKSFENEAAPPMMAVAFHVKDFMQVVNESERVSKAKAFVEKFVLNPSKERSLCDKKSLESYGLMPSQKGKVTPQELEAIASYMFRHYTVKNLTQAQAIQAKMAKMAEGEKLAIRYNCLGCHETQNSKVGPSFCRIAQRYSGDYTEISKAIAKGSSGRYKDVKGKFMPSFAKVISQKEREILAKWIATCDTKK